LVCSSLTAPVSSSPGNEVLCAAGWQDYIPGFSSKEDKTSHSELKFLQISNLSSSSATVTWVSESSDRGRIEYGYSRDLTQEVYEDQEGQVHSVRITGLSTDQTVYYRVHSGDQIRQVRSFKTASIAAGMPRTVYAHTCQLRPPSGDKAMIVMKQNPKTATTLLLALLAAAAMATAETNNLQTSNTTSSSATISWVSSDSVDGSVNYGLTTALGDSVVDASTTHLAEITGLESSTLYYFELRTGTEVDNNGGAYYTFTTTDPGLGTPCTVYGNVLASDSISPVERAILTASVNGTVGQPSLPLSMLTDASGNWFLNLGNLKDGVIDGIYAYSTGDTVFIAAIDGSSEGTADTVVIAGSSPQDCGTLYMLSTGCCIPPIRGDVNYDDAGPNIQDLTFLVAYLFGGGPPPADCP